MRCATCWNTTSFEIVATVRALVKFIGAGHEIEDLPEASVSWGDDSAARCMACGRSGTVATFKAHGN